MKKALLMLMLLLCPLLVAGCNAPVQVNKDVVDLTLTDVITTNQFADKYNIESIGVVVDSSTKVQYLVIKTQNSYGDGLAITPLYNADGTLKLEE